MKACLMIAMLVAAATAVPPTLYRPSFGRTLFATDFGADPSGKNDSSAALQMALEAAAAATQLERAGRLIRLDLESGMYMIETPLNISSMSGVYVGNGQIFAGSSFPADGFLLDGTFTSQFMLEQLTLDASHLAGCLRLDTAMQNTVRDVFFYGFATHGVLGDNQAGMGHELLLQSCFFAEYQWGEPGYNDASRKTGTALEMRYPDSHVLNNIVRCAKVGMVNRAGSNLFEANHIYTTCDHNASRANMTVGYVEAGSNSRFLHGYMDNCDVVVQRTDESHIIKHTLIHGIATLRIQPPTKNEAITGLIISENVFDCTPDGCGAIEYDTSAGGSADASKAANSFVALNWFGNTSAARGTVAKAVVRTSIAEGLNQTVVTVPLGEQLLFPLSLPLVDSNASITVDARIVSGQPASVVATALPSQASTPNGDVRVLLAIVGGLGPADVIVSLNVDVGGSAAIVAAHSD